MLILLGVLYLLRGCIKKVTAYFTPADIAGLWRHRGAVIRSITMRLKRCTQNPFAD